MYKSTLTFPLFVRLHMAATVRVCECFFCFVCCKAGEYGEIRRRNYPAHLFGRAQSHGRLPGTGCRSRRCSWLVCTRPASWRCRSALESCTVCSVSTPHPASGWKQPVGDKHSQTGHLVKSQLYSQFYHTYRT